MLAPAAESHAGRPPLSDIKEDFVWQDAAPFKRSKQQKRTTNDGGAKHRHGLRVNSKSVDAGYRPANDTSGDAGGGSAPLVRRQRPELTRSKTWAGSLSIELLNRKPTQTPPILKSAYHFPSLLTDSRNASARCTTSRPPTGQIQPQTEHGEIYSDVLEEV